ncbi:MAG: EAL domain-containing protein [Succinivibrionaceae bacterium]
MNYKMSPRIWTVAVVFILILLSTVALCFIQNQQLSDKTEIVKTELTNFLTKENELTQEKISEVARANNLSYLAVFEKENTAPKYVADFGKSEYQIESYFPSSHVKDFGIFSTFYTVNFTLNPHMYLNVFLMNLAVSCLGIVISAFLIYSHTQKRILVILKNLIEAIDKRDFSVISDKTIKDKLQKEFGDMSEKISELSTENEQLKILVDQDSLTGISNRKKFRFDLSANLNDTENVSTSLLAIIRATELNSINQTRGFARGDQYLQDVAKLVSEVLKKFTATLTVGAKKKPELYRLSGSDFAIIVPNSTMAMANQLIKDLHQSFDQYMAEHELESTAYTGVTFIKPGQTEEQVLSRADRALSEAQTSAVNSGTIKSETDDDFLKGESQWAGIIQNIIDNRSITLQQQPILSLSFNARCYNEIFTRFVNEEGQNYPTETVIAMAQRHDLLTKLEQTIIESILLRYRKNNLTNQRWGINLSINALISTSFVIWLERQLLKNAEICSNIVFEISENILECNIPAAIRLFDMFRRVNVKSCICKFGNGLGSFRLYRELKPDYIKLDPSLVDTLERDHTSQIFVRTIVEVSHRLGCIVIAEGVEEYSQKQMLESMYIDAVQGYLIAKPSPLNEADGTDPVNSDNNQGVGRDNSDRMI